jgi:pantothenate synthetase
VSARLLHKIAEAREHIAAARERGLTIGLVPTMGALHDGHGALMRLAREETGYVVATIFVNPTLTFAIASAWMPSSLRMPKKCIPRRP